MNLFKNFTKKRVCLIKEVRLTKDGLETQYYSTIDGVYVSNSYSDNKDEAELFFEKILENKGLVKRVENIREEHI